MIKKREPEDSSAAFLNALSNPARNALLHRRLDSIEKISELTEKEILKIHGIGKASLPVLRDSLTASGLSFKQEDEHAKSKR